MKLTYVLTAFTLFASLSTGIAHSEGLTRAEVKAEALRAIAAGETLHDETGETMQQQFPQLYPAPITGPGKSRAEVRADTLEAIRLGLTLQDETGETQAQLYPHLYPQAPR